MTKLQTITTASIFSILLFFTSCNTGSTKTENTWSELPEVTPLETLKETDFAATLENPIAENKNIIYAPAFLYAWNRVQQQLESTVVVTDSNSLDFKLITDTKSYLNSLTDDEYSVDVKIEGRVISAHALFNKTLPFETKLQKLKEPILFNGTKVSAFGMNYFDEEAVKCSRILFYNSDTNFVLKLLPKDKEHEIILVKGLSSAKSLADVLIQTNERIKKGEDEKLKTNNLWMYEILPEDNFAIPIIRFNIATHYSKLEGQTFKTSDSKDYLLFEAWQRTGFILNEQGAVVESEALVTTIEMSMEPVKIHPKKLVFDKTFYIIIKRTNETNPYFVMKADNVELMTKE